MRKHHRIWLIAACGLVLGPIGCQFDSATLDQRRCNDHNECTGGFRCIDHICQGIPPDWDAGEEDLVDMEEVNPCHDYDNDQVFAGEGCTAVPLDCNDFDPNIYPAGGPLTEAALEGCDGKDNDCDGLTDTEDTDDYTADPCPLTQGVCMGSVKACIDGIAQDCTAASYGEDYLVEEATDEAETEDCDNLDNDCDGTIDDGITRTCYNGDPSTLREGAPCSQGYQTCAGDGVFSTQCFDEVLPQDEDTFDNRCDGVDNDCDGELDEECICNPNETRTCYPPTDQSTADHPPCHRGIQTCGLDWHWGPCLDWVGPGQETCANPGIDNDCDGDIRLDDIDGWGETCTDSGEPGECQAGTQYCVLNGSGLAVLDCIPNKVPEQETCANRGQDNDCDGNATDADIPGFGVDCWIELFGGNSVYGECRYGTTECSTTTPSVLICRPSTGTDEVCDLLDNDCDNDIDDGVSTDFDELHCGACFAACGTSETCCDGTCVDTSSDATYCGTSGTEACGVDCDNGLRSDPACCDGACVDLDYDDDHCSACDDDCAEAETCCSGDCFDTTIEELHCGSCDHACSEGTEHCCDSGCVPLDDPDDCGECGNECTGTQSCCADGGAPGGYDCLEWSVTDCGQCGFTCPGDSAEENWECCGGSCVDVFSSESHCGDSCSDTGCSQPNETCCLPTGETAAVCVDTDLNSLRCGACDVSCDSTEHCCDGECVPLSDPDHCGTYGNACTGTTDCCADSAEPGGYDCIDLLVGELRSGRWEDCGECDTDCPIDALPDEDWECCAGFCVNIQNDLDHCGGCPGVECDPTAGELCCLGTCADLDDDPDNCGACGYECDPGQICVNRECVAD